MWQVLFLKLIYSFYSPIDDAAYSGISNEYSLYIVQYSFHYFICNMNSIGNTDDSYQEMYDN